MCDFYFLLFMQKTSVAHKSHQHPRSETHTHTHTHEHGQSQIVHTTTKDSLRLWRAVALIVSSPPIPSQSRHSIITGITELRQIVRVAEFRHYSRQISVFLPSASASAEQRAEPSGAQLWSLRLFWDCIVRRQDDGLIHICQKTRTFKDKRNSPGDNAV